MKRFYFVLCVLTIASTCMPGVISPFSPVENMRFAGKPAAHASGDTLAMVYLDEQDSLTFRLESAALPAPLIRHLHQRTAYSGAPTLLYSPTDSYITTNRGVLKSPNGGELWHEDPFRWVKSFDNSPILEKWGTELKLFENRIPYPEPMQAHFAIPGTDEFPAPQSIVDSGYFPNGIHYSFGGGDYFRGPVFLNSDIWIRQTSGDNDGWPRFDSPVFCTGTVRVYPDGGHNFPEDIIFRGGLFEDQAPTPLPNTDVMRMYANSLGPTNYDPNRIIMVEVDGQNYTSWIGLIQPPQLQELGYWPDYPQGTTQPPTTINSFAICDTLWMPLQSGICANGGMFVNSKLWIKGDFAGKQIWAAADTIFIIGDITLQGVTPGQDPPNADNQVNLISEKSIMLKYGYRSPIDGTRIHPLCRADINPIYIYANLAAVGFDISQDFSGGIISYEYQHPHPSIPAQLLSIPGIGDTLFTQIDLHRNYYPQTSLHLWPSWLDYPWYNPLYPEAHPYLSRGTVKFYGSMYQRLYGFLSNNYVPNPNNNPNGIWNISHGLYGGSSAPTPHELVLWTDPLQSITLQNQNYPGTSLPSIGYKSLHLFPDNFSLNNVLPSDLYNGYWNMGLILRDWYQDVYGNLLQHDTLMKPQLRMTKAKSYATNGIASAYSVNDLLVYNNNETITDLSSSTETDGMIKTLAMGMANSIWTCQDYQENLLLIKQINPTSQQLIRQFTIPVISGVYDLFSLADGRAYLVKQLQDNEFGVYALDNGYYPVLTDSWSFAASPDNPELLITELSKLYILPSGASSARIMLWNPENDNDGRGMLHLATADLTVGNNDESLVPPAMASFTCFPNPMTQALQIKLEIPKQLQAEISIYNLKGQKVKNFPTLSSQAASLITWDGRDNHGRNTASGIYFLRLSCAGKVVQSKRICKL